MSFKSKIDWPSGIGNLPTRHGEAQGHSMESRMLSKTPANEIRTQLRDNLDGSVTMLRTRNGWPEFTTIKAAIEKVIDLARGFVAHVVSASKSALFSPYALSIANDKYTLHAHTYSVLPFASSHNVPVGDTTLWHDVISFKNGKAYINAKTMTDLGSLASTGDGIPHLIPETGTGLEKYGSAETNATVKRVFDVERAVVRSLHTTPVAHSLGGEIYRAEGKALLHGARIDAAAHSAHLSQTVFTGSAWDSLTSAWAVYVSDVQMALSTPFVYGVNSSYLAEGVSAAPALISSSPVSQTTSYDPGSAPVCAYGHLYEAARHNDTQTGAPYLIAFRSVLTDIYSRPPEADIGQTYRSTTGTTAIYSGSSAQTFSAASGDLTVSVDVARERAELSEQVRASLLGETPAVAYTTPSSQTTYVVAMDNDTSPYFDPESDPAASYGERTVFYNPTTIGYVSAARTYTTDSHSVNASVHLSSFAGSVLSVSARIEARDGQEAKLSPVTPTIIPYTTLPQVRVELRTETWWGDVSTALRNAYYSQGGANVQWLAERIVGKPLYSAGRLSAVGYTDTSAARNDFSASLSWETRDCILFDLDEQVFIYVLGSCAGAQGTTGQASMTLDVHLVIDVRGATQYIQLGYYEYSQIELLPTVPMGLGTSLEYLPAPKVRPMFAPMFQSQGDFRGAAYTTAAEETAGATPACVFNFVLELAPYLSVGLTDPSDAVVTFIPCNLLEMLYAYVYSSKYGIDEFERYPVDYQPRFDEISTTLFGVQHRIAYRDGALVDWLDTLNGAYATEQTTELYRT